jgi:hypothetical protein
MRPVHPYLAAIDASESTMDRVANAVSASSSTGQPDADAAPLGSEHDTFLVAQFGHAVLLPW